mgnify:CR=1 FL=1
MVDMKIAEKMGESFKKFSEAVWLAMESIKAVYEKIKPYLVESNNWRKLHGMPMRRWRHLNNAAYNRRKCL